MSQLVTRLRDSYRVARDFFAREIWMRRLDELPRARAHSYRAARVLTSALQELVLADSLHVRAAALTYFTVLSLVPLLAFAFAVLKGFGTYDALINQNIRPYVTGMLEGNGALQTAFDQILGFVEHTSVTRLGLIGLLTLLYAATRLLRNIERALNETWGIPGGRKPVDQLRDYVAIIVVTPICLTGAFALTTAREALDIVRAAGDTLGVSGLLDSLLSLLGPLAVLFLGLLVLYKVMPYTSVHSSSAALGAAVGSLLWYGVLLVHVRFQVGVAQYNALYSSFGAIPIFLAWLQISWLVVLVGAQVSAAHQNHRGLAQQRRAAEGQHSNEEAAGLAAVLHVASSFLDCKPPPTSGELGRELDIPEVTVDALMDRLIAAGLLSRVVGADEPGYVLQRPASRIRVKDVLDALRPTPSGEQPRGLSLREQLALRLWRELDAVTRDCAQNRSLREVLADEALRDQALRELAHDGRAHASHEHPVPS